MPEPTIPSGEHLTPTDTVYDLLTARHAWTSTFREANCRALAVDIVAALAARDDEPAPTPPGDVTDGAINDALNEGDVEWLAHALRVWTAHVARQSDIIAELRAALAARDDEPGGMVCACGLPMSRNPHPDAGEPTMHGVDIGAAWVCIPCTMKALSGWSRRARSAEAVLARARAILTEGAEVIKESRRFVEADASPEGERMLIALADVLSTDEPGEGGDA